jgi:hypothetical protein
MQDRRFRCGVVYSAGDRAVICSHPDNCERSDMAGTSPCFFGWFSPAGQDGPFPFHPVRAACDLVGTGVSPSNFLFAAKQRFLGGPAPSAAKKKFERLTLSVVRILRPTTVVFALALILISGLWQPAAAQTDREDALASFLDRLGLVDLQVLHLEKSLQAKLPADQQLRLARRLGDLYAGQLMDSAEDKQRSAEILGRIQTLIEQVPQADTPALRVMLLQADYNHAETLAVRWIGDSADTEARTQALEILERIAPELNAFQQELNALADSLVDTLANLPEGNQRDASTQQFNRVQAVAGRATYFAGWSNYYWGLMRGKDGEASIRLAREAFRKLLDIRTEQYASLDAEWLGLESIWRCRALIGLGLCEAALGQVDESRACFHLLEHASVPPEMQDQAAFWYLQGLLNAGRFDEAAQYAAARVATYAPPPSQGKVSVCVSLVRAAFGDRRQPPTGNRRRLGILGLEGLARLGQQRTIEQLNEQYRIDPGDDAGFFLAWSAGRKLLAAADESKREEDYRAAIKQLDAALQASDADRQLDAAARCRHELAYCRFQVQDYEQAARLAQLAWTGLKPTDPQTAVQAAWMAFASYQKLADQQPQFVPRAVDVLRTLQRDFPTHPYAKRADYLIDKLQRHSESPEDTIRRLEKIPADDPSYLAVRYDLCLLWHQRWAQASPPDEQIAGQVVKAARAYLDTALQDRDEQRKAKCCLVAAEVSLAHAGDQGTTAAAYLDQATDLVASLPDGNPLAVEYQYRRLQLASLRKQDGERQQRAQWLMKNAAGTAYELPALVVVARAADQRVESSAAGERRTALQDARRIYQRLAERLGSSANTLQNNQNARVSLSRSADYAMQLEQYRDAAVELDALVDAFPADRNYLRRSGLAHFQSGQYPKSLARWRALLLGVGSGTDGWYEAKYYQILCLRETDPETARKVFDQFKLLDPELGPPPWREKFQALLRFFLK